MPDGFLSSGVRHCHLLVFDLDGTLIDSQQDLANAVNATLQFLSRPRLQDPHIAAFTGDGAAMLVRRALEATARPGEAVEPLMPAAMPFFLDYYREHKLDTTSTYPGVLDALRLLRDTAPRLPMAVLTNKPYRPARAICDGLGLSHFFFRNYGGDSFPLKKPDPAGMHALMAEAAEVRGTPVSPGRVVLVGDSRVDVETARAAGVLCLGCTYGMDTERLLAARPDALAHAPSAWLAALDRMLI